MGHADQQLGDGRADLWLVQESGEAVAWLDRGTGDAPNYHRLDVVAIRATVDSKEKKVLADFTGNGRVDYIAVDDNGRARGYANQPREDKGLGPRWRAPVVVADGPDGAKQSNVRFFDMTGNFKADYLLVDEKTGKIECWDNRGSGGRFQKGEGAYIADCKWMNNNTFFLQVKNPLLHADRVCSEWRWSQRLFLG